MFRSAYGYADFCYNIVCALFVAATDFSGSIDRFTIDRWLSRRRWLGNPHSRTKTGSDLDYSRGLASHTGR